MHEATDVEFGVRKKGKIVNVRFFSVYTAAAEWM